MKFTYPIRLIMQPELISEAEDGVVGFARNLAERFNLPTTLIKFMIVGGIGFVILQAITLLVYETGFGFLPDKEARADLLVYTSKDIRLLVASIVAVEAAIFVQFNSHERWTFRRRKQDGNLLVRFAKFNLSSAAAFVTIVTTVNILTPEFGWSPYIANIVGVALGFIWNWTINTLIIWPRQRREAEERSADAQPVDTAEPVPHDSATS
jgi:putative flippase GtrA